MKKNISIIISAMVVTAILLPQIGNVKADNLIALSFTQAFTKIQENDLNQQISTNGAKLSKLEAAYSGGGQVSPVWASVYGISVSPLLSKATSKATDYSTLSTSLTNQLSYYNQLYSYWAAKETMDVYSKSKDLASQAYGIAKIKNANGSISNDQLYQAEISLNKAKLQELQGQTQLQMAKYSINKSLGGKILEDIDIEKPSFTFIDNSQLDFNLVVNDVLINHKALIPAKAAVEAYTNAVDVASKQDKFKVSMKDGLVDFYNQELSQANMKLKQLNLGIEVGCDSYITTLKSLEAQINLNQTNIKLEQDSYTRQIKMYELGQITSVELEQQRNSIQADNLQLTLLKKTYLSTKQEYTLFRAGYLKQ